jgi:hypothetical protein
VSQLYGARQRRPNVSDGRGGPGCLRALVNAPDTRDERIKYPVISGTVSVGQSPSYRTESLFCPVCDLVSGIRSCVVDQPESHCGRDREGRAWGRAAGPGQSRVVARGGPFSKHLVDAERDPDDTQSDDHVERHVPHEFVRRRLEASTAGDQPFVSPSRCLRCVLATSGSSVATRPTPWFMHNLYYA